MTLLAFEAPSVEEMFEFQPLTEFTIGGLHLSITFPTVVMFALSLLLVLFFAKAFARPKMVPTGSQNVGEASLDLIRNQIALPILGHDGVAWVPFLTVLFFWIFVMNIMGIVPGVQYPITSRIAYPVMLALVAWIVYNGVGIKHQGFFGYFKNVLFPPGVPKPVYLILSPIELVSQILLRPLTLAVRLFANVAAGHVILTVLFLGTAVFFQSGLGKVTFVLPFALGLVMMLFEVFVAAMQAFIFTVLTAVYIAGAAHPEH